MARTPGLTPEALLGQYPPPIVAVANELRAFVRARVPEAREVAYAGWRAIGYRHPAAGYLGGVFLFDDHVMLLFEHGNLLPDPAAVLHGNTKQTRFIPLGPGDAIPFDAIASFLAAAVDIGSDLRQKHKAP